MLPGDFSRTRGGLDITCSVYRVGSMGSAAIDGQVFVGDACVRTRAASGVVFGGATAGCEKKVDKGRRLGCSKGDGMGRWVRPENSRLLFARVGVWTLRGWTRGARAAGGQKVPGFRVAGLPV